MRKINNKLDSVLTELGADEEMKKILLDFLMNQVNSVNGQIFGLRNNAKSLERQANQLEEESTRLNTMINYLTEEVEEEETEVIPPENEAS